MNKSNWMKAGRPIEIELFEKGKFPWSSKYKLKEESSKKARILGKFF